MTTAERKRRRSWSLALCVLGTLALVLCLFAPATEAAKRFKETKRLSFGTLRDVNAKTEEEEEGSALLGSYFESHWEADLFSKDLPEFQKRREVLADKVKALRRTPPEERTPLYFGFVRPLMFSFQNIIDWLQSGIFEAIHRPLLISEHGGTSFLEAPNLILFPDAFPSPLYLNDYTSIHKIKPILFMGLKLQLLSQSLIFMI